MTNQTFLISGVLLVLGLLLVWMGLRRLFARQLFSGSIMVLSAVCIIALAAGAAGTISNLHTYQSLTKESLIGDISFAEYSPQEFIATVVFADESRKEFSILGEECQIDARVLKWRGPANLLGFETLYRLERLSGRYRTVQEEQQSPRSVHALAEQAGIELWALVNKLDNWVPWVDAIYGGGVYIPMKNKASYSISMTTSGLIARPGNKVAEKAIKNWE